MNKGIFVIGTGTDVGKTYVTALMLKKLREDGIKAAYFKAAMSGNERGEDGSLLPGDAWYVKRISGIDEPVSRMCPYVYEHAYSPHLAARIEGNPVEIDRVKSEYLALCSEYEYIVAEGSGGILCPIRAEDGETGLWLPDIIRATGLDCLLVADAGLGTINAAGLTAAYLKQRGIALRGIIFNRYQPGNLLHEDNRKMCETLTGVPVIGCVTEGGTEITAANLWDLTGEIAKAISPAAVAHSAPEKRKI